LPDLPKRPSGATGTRAADWARAPVVLRSSYACTVIGVLTVVVPGVWSDVMFVVSE
jgi:hypothetical protein